MTPFQSSLPTKVKFKTKTKIKHTVKIKIPRLFRHSAATYLASIAFQNNVHIEAAYAIWRTWVVMASLWQWSVDERHVFHFAAGTQNRSAVLEVERDKPVERGKQLYRQRAVDAFASAAEFQVPEVEDSGLLELDLPGEAEACKAARADVLQQSLAKGIFGGTLSVMACKLVVAQSNPLSHEDLHKATLVFQP